MRNRCSNYLINRHTYRVYESNLHCWQLVFFFSVHHVLQANIAPLYIKALFNLIVGKVSLTMGVMLSFSLSISPCSKNSLETKSATWNNAFTISMKANASSTRSSLISRDRERERVQLCSLSDCMKYHPPTHTHNIVDAQNALIQMKLGDINKENRFKSNVMHEAAWRRNLILMPRKYHFHKWEIYISIFLINITLSKTFGNFGFENKIDTEKYLRINTAFKTCLDLNVWKARPQGIAKLLQNKMLGESAFLFVCARVKSRCAKK